MIKKSLVFLSAVLILATMAYGLVETGAWFTDTGEVTGNSVTTGSLDLTVWGGPFSGTNLEPGADYTSLGVFCARNDGNYNMKWRGWIDSVYDPKELKNKLYVKVIMNPTGYEGNYGPPNTQLFSGAPFVDLMSANDYIVLNDPVWPFAPGHWACYEVLARLDSSAGDGLQNATLNARFYLQATQYINPGWSQ